MAHSRSLTTRIPNPLIHAIYTLLFTAPLALAVGCSSNSPPAAQTPSAAPGSASPSAPTIKIAVQPADENVPLGQAVSFRVAASGNGPLSYQWQRDGQNIPGATSVSYRIPPSTASDDGAAFRVIITDASTHITSAPARLAVLDRPPSADVLTYHNDNLRTGQNLGESILTPRNVNATNFGKVGFISVQGRVDAEPLYVSHLTIRGASHNVLFVSTEHDWIYAFDADTFVQLWRTSLLGPGETPSDDRKCAQVSPEIGVTSTPVIDLHSGPHGTLFAVAMSKDAAGRYFQRLHALDIATGEERGTPTAIEADVPGSGPNSKNGRIIFDPKQYEDRASLLLTGGAIYTAWSSHCDVDPYNSWVIAFDESTLHRAKAISLTPNGTEGGIWMAGAGLASDASGNIFFEIGNGAFDTTLDSRGFPIHRDFGNSIIKLSPAAKDLAVLDYFTMHNVLAENKQDADLGSGGLLLLPDLKDSSGKPRHLALGAGKDWTVYIVDRDAMGHFNPQRDNIYQELSKGLGGAVFAMPAYFNGTVYYGPYLTPLMAFPVKNARLPAAPSSKSPETFDYPGATPSISANGTRDAIVWAVENSTSGILHAYDAANLAREYYNSNQAGQRDQFADNKFITPMIANGKVYVGTPTGVIVFGLLP